MQRKDRVRLEDRLDNAEKALGFVNGRKRDDQSLHNVAALLAVMDRQWGDVFRLILGKNERSPVNELLAVYHPPGAKIQASGHHAARHVAERVAR